MPKEELNAEDAVNQAVEDVRLAMVAKIKAEKSLVVAMQIKEKARFTLQKAKERLIAVEKDFT